SNGLSSEDAMRESPRSDSTTAASRPVAGTWAESARARRIAMIWSTSSRSRAMAGATRWPPRTISRQKSARNSRSVCGRDFSEDGKRVARGLLEQALGALDEDDLAVLRAENGAKLRPVRRHLRGGQRGVQMRLREFLDAEAKQEMIQGEHADGVLAHGGFAAA